MTMFMYQAGEDVMPPSNENTNNTNNNILLKKRKLPPSTATTTMTSKRKSLPKKKSSSGRSRKKEGPCSKKCHAPGCTRFYRSGSKFCVKHGGGRRCQHPEGCSKSAQGSTNFCCLHGGGRRCQYAGCKKGARNRSDYCISHGNLMKRESELQKMSLPGPGVLDFIPPRQNPPTNSISMSYSDPMMNFQKPSQKGLGFGSNSSTTPKNSAPGPKLDFPEHQFVPISLDAPLPESPTHQNYLATFMQTQVPTPQTGAASGDETPPHPHHHQHQQHKNNAINSMQASLVNQFQSMTRSFWSSGTPPVVPVPYHHQEYMNGPTQM